MNKREFLNKLNEYLSYELPASMVREKLSFYSDYIDSEAAAGKSAAEVIEGLGDPQLIARTIIDAAKSGPDGIPGTDDDVDFGENIAQNKRAEREYGSNYSYGNNGSSGSGTNRGTVSEDGKPDEGDYTHSETNTHNPFGGMQVYNVGCLTAMLVMIVVFFLLGTVLQVLSPLLTPICICLLIIWLIGKISGGRR